MKRKIIKQANIINEGKIYNTFVNDNIVYNNGLIQNQQIGMRLKFSKFR